MLTVSVCHSVHPEYAFTYYSWSLCHSSINRNFPLLAPSQPSLFNNIETFTTASRPLRSWRTFPGWRKHSTTSSAFRTRWRRCPRKRSNSKSCKEYALLIYIVSIIGLKMYGGKYFLDFGLCDAHIIQGPDLDLKYKISRYLISSKTTSFSMFYQYASDGRPSPFSWQQLYLWNCPSKRSRAVAICCSILYLKKLPFSSSHFYLCIHVVMLWRNWYHFQSLFQLNCFTSCPPIMRSALIKLREGRGEVFNHLAEDSLQPEKENREEEEGNSLLQLLDPLSNKLKRGSCFEIPQPKRKRSLPCDEDLLLEEKFKRNKRCPSEESNNSIDAELNRHFRPIKRAPLSPPKVSFLRLSII